MENYFRPLLSTDLMRPHQAFSFAGGPLWFSHAEVLNRDQRSLVVPVDQVPQDWLKAWTRRRLPIMDVAFETPKVMGILNVTPDSFSDGGLFSSTCLLYTSPSPRDLSTSRMPSSA